MSYIRNVEASIADSPSVDPFSRLRISAPYGLLEIKYPYDRQPILTDELTSGAGSSVAHDINNACCILTAGSGTADYAIKAARFSAIYTPGKGTLCFMTGVLGEANSQAARRIGMFTDNNGLFFEYTNVLKVVKRTDSSGTPTDTAVSQSDFNLDKMDGTGPSGITLDLTKAHIFIIDFQWLGVGRVRFGFDIDGKVFYCHEMLHSNVVTDVYMRQPSLPPRWEIRKSGGSSAVSMKAICASVSSEAGYNPIANKFCASRGTSLKSVSTRALIFALRLKNSFNTLNNRKLARLSDTNFYTTTDPVLFELHQYTDVSSVTGNFSDVNVASGCEYSTDITAISGGSSIKIAEVIVPASSSGGKVYAGSGSYAIDAYASIGEYISQNIQSNKSQIWAIFATALSNTPSVSCEMQWIEYQ